MNAALPAADAAAAEGNDDSPIERVFAAARDGDRETQYMIILGGLFAAGQDVLVPQIEETIRLRSFAGLGDRVSLRVTTFGRQVGVIGAAALALDAFFYGQDPLPVA
jgi:hypothetical protein